MSNNIIDIFTISKFFTCKQNSNIFQNLVYNIKILYNIFSTTLTTILFPSLPI